MRITRRIAVARKQVQQLAAIAEARAVAARKGTRVAPTWRPLNAAEAEILLGSHLLASITAVLRS